MPGHENSIETELSSDPEQRIAEYRKAARNARLRAYALLETAGLEPEEADAVVSAIEVGALARVHGDVQRGSWDAPEGLSERLVRTVDRLFQQRGRAAAAARLQAGKPAPDRAGELERLRAFARQALHRTHPHTMERRRVLELLGEDGQLCNARTIEYSTGDVIWCTREAGHYDPDVKPEGDDPGGWHLCNGRRWMDDRPYNHPHKSA